MTWTNEEHSIPIIKPNEIDDKTAEGIARAFWRRIYFYRNNYERELPKEIPVEFLASMQTALLLLEKNHDTDNQA